MKKLLIGLLACSSLSAFASVGDVNDSSVGYSMTGIYQKFEKELKSYKLPNRVTYSVTFSNAEDNFINVKQNNLDALNVVIGSNDSVWYMYDFDYSYKKDPMTKEKVLVNYVKTQQMPIGGYVTDDDLDEAKIHKSLDEVKQLAPKYSSNKLYSISVSKKLDPSGGVTLYTYKFNKNNKCYNITYAYQKENIADMAEVSCPDNE